MALHAYASSSAVEFGRDSSNTQTRTPSLFSCTAAATKSSAATTSVGWWTTRFVFLVATKAKTPYGQGSGRSALPATAGRRTDSGSPTQ